MNVNFKSNRRVCTVRAEIKSEDGMEEADTYTRTDSTATTASRRLSGAVMGTLRKISTSEEAPHESLVFYTDGEGTEDWARKISEVLDVMGSEDSD